MALSNSLWQTPGRDSTVKFPVAAIDNSNVDCDASICHITMYDTSLVSSYNVVYEITIQILFIFQNFEESKKIGK